MSYENAFAALADPTRRRIVETLSAGPKSVSRIADSLPVSRPAVSQHLAVLADAGLVVARPEGTRRIYALRPAGAEPIRTWLDNIWGDALSAFARAAREESER